MAQELTQQAIPISDRTADRRHSEHPPSRIVRPNSSSGSKSLVGRRKTPHPNPSSHSKPLESFDGQLVEKKMLFGRTQRQGASSPTDTVVERPAAAPVGSTTVRSAISRAISHSVLSLTALCIFSLSAISHCVFSLTVYFLTDYCYSHSVVSHCVVYSHAHSLILTLLSTVSRYNTTYQAVSLVWCTAD